MRVAVPPVWRALLISAVAIFLAALLGIELTRSAGNVASVWLASGVTIGLMLRWQDQWRQVLVLIVSGVAILVANLIHGDPFPVALGLTVANMAGVLAVIIGLGLIGWQAREIEDGLGILKFALVVILVGPTVGGVIGALVIHLAYGAPFTDVLEHWILSDAVGNFILAPALISLDAGKRLAAHLRYFGLCLAGLVGVGLAAILAESELLLFLMPPLMILLASRVGIAAVGAAGTVVAVGAAWTTVNAIGPIYLSVDGDIGTAIREIQVLLIFTIGIGQLVAVLMEERRRAEFDLRLYRTIIENAPDGVLLADLQGNFILWNARLLEILGMTEEEFARNHQLGRAEYREENAAINARLAAGEHIHGMPFRRHTNDGRPIIAELDGVPILNDGSFAGAAVMLRDVSEQLELRRRAENRTRELEAFLDAAAEGVIGTDADGRITIWNRAAEAIYGIAADEARQMYVRELPSGDPVAVRDERLRRLRRGEKFRNLRSMRTSRDGTERQVEVSINPIFDQDGVFAGTAGSLRDLTEIRSAEARSLESQRQLADAIRAITDAIAIFDSDERLVHFNGKYARLVSAVPNLRPGMSWEMIIRANLDAGTLNLPEGETDVDAWIEMRRQQRRGEDVPFLLSLPGGVWLVGRDYPMDDGGFISIRQDVSELKQREAELARSNRDLEQFAFIASHDLREPLRKIQSFGEILTADYADSLPDEARTFLGYMTDGADRMEGLIDDLLQFSRAGRSDEALIDIDLNEAVSEAVDNLLVPITESDARLTVGDLPMVRGRHGDLVRVFQNLIGNSIKYRDPERPLEIHVQAGATSRDHVCVSVVDNGSGIDAAHSEIIFEPFKRLAGNAGIKGTGMGLAIVRKLVAGLGGTVWLDSGTAASESAGAHFVLKLLIPSESDDSGTRIRGLDPDA
ncbi:MULTISPECIES: PAS domain S-box protein [unclassified Minwuia]|jgi:PAS domain S-box-containing protein|uniref:PAS domain S-box protein n=1 Tax=unclassified Minwuia TaxID=2618799 RepID=UPI0024791D57|nr:MULTISPECIES: PAS domain S-box protein [unclassified Minwuia]